MCQLCAQFNPFLADCEYEAVSPGGDGPVMAAGATLNETTDAAGSTATSYSMGVGDYFFGELATGTDRDWVEVSLTAGQTYTFGLTGVGALDEAANDTYLRLHNATGTEIASDDDDGPGRNSVITYTATSSGTYYLDVGSYVGVDLPPGDEGLYGLSMVQGNRASYDVTMGAGALLRPAASWAATPGTGATVTWSIRASGTEPDGGNPFIAPSAAQVAAIGDALSYFEAVSGLNFTQVAPGGASNNAAMVFGAYSADDGSGAYAYYPGSTAAGATDGDVWLNNNSGSTSSLPEGSYSYFVLLHEIGHALGLAHPGDYNAGVGTTITYDQHAQFSEDTHQYTVMSYFDESNTTGSFGSYPDTMMMYDLLALHQLYGANTGFHAGNTTYGFNATVGGAYDFTTNTDPFLCIWDGSGSDTLDLSGYSMAQLISLAAGTFSNVGGYVGNLSIAIGALIENAVGGSGNDTIAGNSADNRVTGNGGSDTFVMDLDRSAATVTVIGGGFQVVSSLGTDALLGVEFIQFNDQTLDLSSITGGGGGPTIGNDTLSGTSADNSIDLLAGNDQYSGGDGNDLVLGNDGNDVLSGDGGNDTLNGGAGDEWSFGGSGNDSLTGEGGADHLFGGSDNDTLQGGDDNDVLTGEWGHDVLSGDNGNDELHGNQYEDWLFGGAGEDTLYGDEGFDNLYGGIGNDTIYGGENRDTLVGEWGDDVLSGENGNDVLHGHQNEDWIFGGAGHDTLYGDEGFDNLYGGLDADTLYGGENRDTLNGEQGNDVLSGDNGNDVLNGGAEDDWMFGGAGNDTLNGDSGNDHLFGSLGDDRLDGGSGNDTLNGEQGNDVFVFTDGHGADVIDGFEASNAAEDIDLSAIAAITGFTDLSDNHMSQQGGNVVIDTGTGTITLTGVSLGDLDGNDFLF